MKFPVVSTVNIAQIFFLLFLITLFFPIRYVFPNQQTFQTGAYSDFTSISLYLSDIFLFLAVIFTFSPRGGKSWSISKLFSWLVIPLILWLIIELFVHLRLISPLNMWFFVKFLELIVAYETSKHLFKVTLIKPLFLRVFVIFSSFESILALIQFCKQSSVGGIVHKLGESVISPKILGIAKVVSHGTQYIRGYGTFPHPNLLSAFLVVGVLLNLYLLIKAKELKYQILLGISIFINILGVTVTFSRAAYLGLGIALVIFFGQILIRNTSTSGKHVKLAFIVTILSTIVSFAFFHQFLSSRTTVTDSASLERIFYAKIGIKMIEQHPIFGVGVGESVLHMQQYSPIKLWPWQIQPIHNYFLLAAAELGIPGALILIWFFLNHLFRLIKSSAKENSIFCFLLSAIFFSLLLMMQFDHYFYTLQQTQMLLWVILGIISAEVSNAKLEREFLKQKTAKAISQPFVV